MLGVYKDTEGDKRACRSVESRSLSRGRLVFPRVGSEGRRGSELVFNASLPSLPVAYTVLASPTHENMADGEAEVGAGGEGMSEGELEEGEVLSSEEDQEEEEGEANSPSVGSEVPNGADAGAGEQVCSDTTAVSRTAQSPTSKPTHADITKVRSAEQHVRVRVGTSTHVIIIHEKFESI